MLRASLRYLPIALPLLAIQLDFFDLNVAIPRVAAEFGVPVTDLQWLVSGYLLALGALFIPAGKIGDLIGRKRTILIGAGIFGAFSLASGLAPDAGLLIGFRVLQGIGAGLIMPNVFALVGATTTEATRGRVFTVLLTIGAVGTALGPLIGGWFTATIGWRWLFFINVPIVLACLAFAAVIPEFLVSGRRRSLRELDWGGLALIVPGIVLVCVGLDDIATFGLGHWLTWGPFALGLVLLAAFVLRIRTAREPLVRPSLFRDPQVLVMALSGSVLNLSVSIIAFTMTLQLQTVDGFAPAIVGIMFLGNALGIALASALSSWITTRFGARPTFLVVLAVDAALLVLAAFAPSLPVYLAAMGVASFCSGIGWSVAQIGAQTYLEPELQGEGAGLLSMLMTVWGGVAVVLAGVAIDAISRSTTPTPGALDWTLCGNAVLLGIAFVVVLATTPRRPVGAQNAIR